MLRLTPSAFGACARDRRGLGGSNHPCALAPFSSALQRELRMAYFYGLEADDDFDDPEDDLRLYDFSLEEDDWVPYEVVKLRQFGFSDGDIFDALTGYGDDSIGTGDPSDSSFGMFQFDSFTNSLFAERVLMDEATSRSISRKSKSLNLSKNHSTIEM